MCPPGDHHNGFMATPELGHRMYGHRIFIYIWAHTWAQDVRAQDIHI